MRTIRIRLRYCGILAERKFIAQTQAMREFVFRNGLLIA